MKLSKTSWLFIAIGIFVITFASLGTVRYQQVRERNQLSEQLTVAETQLNSFKLDQLSEQPEALEKQLIQIMSQFETAKTILSQSNESIATGRTVFDIAAAHGVEVTEITSSGLASDALEGLPCSVLQLSARIVGGVSDLIDFIIKLNSDLTTGILKSVEIGIPEATSGANSSANIQLSIYTYQGE